MTKLSRGGPFLCSHLYGGTLEDIFSFNSLLTKLVLKWQTAQAKTSYLKKY